MTGDVIVITLNKRFVHVSHCYYGTEFNVASHILNFLALSFLLNYNAIRLTKTKIMPVLIGD